MNIQNVIDRLRLPPGSQPLVEQLDRVWRSASALAAFPCLSKCVSCCNNVGITCAKLEFEIAKAHIVGKPVPGVGCIFRTRTGCSVYEHRPMVCRLFGYATPYDVPAIAISKEIAGKQHKWVIASMGKCPRKRKVTNVPRLKLAEIMDAYQAILMQTGLVIIGTYADKALNKEMEALAGEFARQNEQQFWFPSLPKQKDFMSGSRQADPENPFLGGNARPI